MLLNSHIQSYISHNCRFIHSLYRLTYSIHVRFFLLRPSEMVQSIKEYTEDDVTDQMGKGSFPFASSEHGPAFFHGLHRDIEAIERGFFGGIGRFFQAAEEMKNEFFNSIGVPELYDHDSPHKKGGVYIESRPPKEAVAKEKSGDVDLFGLARDV